jgi:hypothetical protein
MEGKARTGGGSINIQNPTEGRRIPLLHPPLLCTFLSILPALADLSFIYEGAEGVSNRAAQVVVTLQPVAKWSFAAFRRLENCSFRSSWEATGIRSWEQPASELFCFFNYFFPFVFSSL